MQSSNHSSKKKTKGKKKGKNNISKVEKRYLKILISAHAWAKIS